MHHYYTTVNVLENTEEKTVSNYAVQENQTIQELQNNYTSAPATVKAINLWQPWASLIPLGLKHYETRGWKTKYRGKLLICSTAKFTKKQHQQYLKICNEVDLPVWDKDNFPRGCAFAICDLVDCIEMTPEFIAQQSETEILCGDWQVGRFAWKLENIQPLTEPFPVKGKQKLFNVPFDSEYYLKTKDFDNSTPSPKNSKSKSSDCWYTPLSIVELVIKVLGEITLDPCADDGKHLEARKHYTIVDDGLTREWEGQVFMNPPYSHPAVWMKKLQMEMESGRVKEAIALLPAATDTNWLSPVLKTQPVCFWKGRIKFLGEDYQPKNAARQSHVLVYWGGNWERFREVFEGYGFVSVPSQFLEDKLNDDISSRKNKDKKFLEDKLNNGISSRKNEGGLEFLEDNLNNGISSRKAENEKFLEDKLNDDISSRKNEGDLEFLEDNPKDKISSRKTRRRKGSGSGCIYYRTVTKKGKEYREAYYQYEVWKDGDCLAKSTKYIPKRLLSQVQRLEVKKAPVREILKLLEVNL